MFNEKRVLLLGIRCLVNRHVFLVRLGIIQLVSRTSYCAPSSTAKSYGGVRLPIELEGLNVLFGPAKQL